ncbi:DUF4136 domain-containing protein [Sandaracinobacter neustonicus]|uniref:DUF4136 domain-containing protein n=2 Tax=Sandaracinobacter neustonicus TaxID=1715348 RepID=A0A501XTD7_9SPHN|nr:DUF4136 domain-containing protein [Sandaracinobacter neustonicus]
MLLAAGLALLAACAQPFEARVQSFQSMPPAQGQTFTIQPASPDRQGSLEFAAYSGLIATELQKHGFQQAASPEQAYLTVLVDFGSGPGRERIATRPATPSTWGWYGRGGWYGRPGGWWGPWGDPFWDPWNQPDVYSFTVYPAFLDVTIKRTADKTPVFEGRAQTTTRVNDLPSTMPNLVSAMFQDFPGASSRSAVVKVPQNR